MKIKNLFQYLVLSASFYHTSFASSGYEPVAHVAPAVSKLLGLHFKDKSKIKKIEFTDVFNIVIATDQSEYQCSLNMTLYQVSPQMYKNVAGCARNGPDTFSDYCQDYYRLLNDFNLPSACEI